MARFNIAVSGTENDLLTSPINFSTSGNNTVVAGKTGTIIRVFRYFLIVGNTTSLTYQNGPSVAFTGAMPLVANEAMVFTLDTRPWYTCSPGNDFVINSSNSVQVGGAVYYTQDNQ